MDAERLDAIKAQLTDRPSDPSATVESFPEGTVGFVILNAWLADRDAARELVAEVERLRAENDRLRVMWDLSGKNDLLAERDVLRAQREAVLAICTGPTTGENKIEDWFLAIRGIYGVSE